MRQKEKILGLVTCRGFVHLFPFFPSVFVSLSLQIQAEVCFHLTLKYVFAGGVLCGEQCCQPVLPGGTHLGPILLVAAPTDISLSGVSVMAGWALVVLTVIARSSLSTAIRERGENKVHYSQVLEAVQRGHG